MTKAPAGWGGGLSWWVAVQHRRFALFLLLALPAECLGGGGFRTLGGVDVRGQGLPFDAGHRTVTCALRVLLADGWALDALAAPGAPVRPVVAVVLVVLGAGHGTTRSRSCWAAVTSSSRSTRGSMSTPTRARTATAYGWGRTRLSSRPRARSRAHAQIVRTCRLRTSSAACSPATTGAVMATARALHLRGRGREPGGQGAAGLAEQPQHLRPHGGECPTDLAGHADDGAAGAVQQVACGGGGDTQPTADAMPTISKPRRSSPRSAAAQPATRRTMRTAPSSR